MGRGSSGLSGGGGNVTPEQRQAFNDVLAESVSRSTIDVSKMTPDELEQYRNEMYDAAAKEAGLTKAQKNAIVAEMNAERSEQYPNKVESLAQGMTKKLTEAQKERGETALSNSDMQAAVEAYAKTHAGIDADKMATAVRDRVDVLNFSSLSGQEKINEMRSVQNKVKTAKSYVTKTQKAVDQAREGYKHAETDKLKAQYQKKIDKAVDRFNVAVETWSRWSRKLNAYEDIYQK